MVRIHRNTATGLVWTQADFVRRPRPTPPLDYPNVSGVIFSITPGVGVERILAHVYARAGFSIKRQLGEEAFA